MKVPDTVKSALYRLEGAGFEAWLVGGCVRDSLLGREPGDFDLCTSARPEETAAAFSDCRVIETGIRHGTVTVLWEGLSLEITTYRCDGPYSDGRRPDSVSFTPSLEEDLKRRDFTINAMAWHPERGLVDLFGGEEDLRRGIIRCVGEPRKRFWEDALRILRALRFASRYGFEIEYGTAASMHREAALMALLAGERVLTELRGILCGKGAGAMLEEFADVFRVIMPELKEAPVDRYPANFELRMALILGEEAEFVLRRLKCDNATLESVKLLGEGLRQKVPETVPELRRLLARCGEERVRLLSTAKGFDALLDEALAQGGPLSVKELAVHGADLIEAGTEKGPAVGEALQKLLEAVWDGKCVNEREALLAYASTLADSKPLR